MIGGGRRVGEPSLALPFSPTRVEQHSALRAIFAVVLGRPREAFAASVCGCGPVAPASGTGLAVGARMGGARLLA